MTSKTKFILLAFATVVMGTAAVSSQSLWIDEGTSAVKALQPTLPQWWQSLRADGTSNLQLPLHFLYLWGWEKLFGSSESALRSANIPLLFLGLCALMWGFQNRPRMQFWLVLLALTNAFTWYYINEARPYILLFAASSLCLACLARAYYSPEQRIEDKFWFSLLCAGTVLVAATSLVAVPWAAGFFVGGILVVAPRNFLEQTRRHFVSSAIFIFLMLCLGSYYLWTITLGATASDVGRTGVSNLFFTLYEQCGLTGLGPGRNDLRENGLHSLIAFAPALVIGTLTLFPPAFAGFRAVLVRLSESKMRRLGIVVVALPLLTVLLAGHAMHVRILGRHLTPLFLFILLGLSLGLERMAQSRRSVGRIAIVLFLIFQTLSSLQIRLAPRHSRDDYRTAAAFALQTFREGGTVWWAADRNTGMYYHLPLQNSGGQFGIIPIIDPNSGELINLPAPQMIILSKPDTYDSLGAIRKYAASSGLHKTVALQSFQIWER